MRNNQQAGSTTKSTRKRSSSAKATIATRKSGVVERSTRPPVSSQDRQHMIAEAAYFMAEERGFAPGMEVDDWARAERVVDTQLAT